MTSHPDRLSIRLKAYPLLAGHVLYAIFLTLCLTMFALSLYGKMVFGATGDCETLYASPGYEDACDNWRVALYDFGLEPVVFEGYFFILRVVAALPFFILSYLLIRNRGQELRVLLFASFLLLLGGAGTLYNPFWVWSGGWFTEKDQLQLLPFLSKLLEFLGAIGIALFAFLFPDGRFIPRWSRWVIIVWAVQRFGVTFFPETAASVYTWPYAIGFISTTIIELIIIGAFVWRYHADATPVQRQQMKWITAGVLLLALNYALDYGVWEVYTMLTNNWLIATHQQAIVWELFQDTLWYVGQFIFGICVGMAVFRHRLWDIDLILSRTLIYGSLTALIIALYITIVGGLGVLFQVQTNTLTGLAATGIIAVLFQPLRDRLQRLVNRLLYGERDDPAKVLTRLAHHLTTVDQPTVILPNLVQTIAYTLKIPYVGIWLPVDDQMELAASWGSSANPLHTIQLIYQNQTLGHLNVAQRGPFEPFHHHEQELLATIAALTATTIRAVQLSDELQRSRQRIITAREEERRRLRRDLHDGLGPQLASQTLGLDAISRLMISNPQKAQSLLEALKTQAQEAILDVRRLVYDLRPPALDDLGLVGALQQTASRYESASLRFAFDVPKALPELPAAVETATYRIAQEAMTNVVRHAQATYCKVSLHHEKHDIVIEIQDNGIGLSTEHPVGIGLKAMSERATELNGQCIVESVGEGGTRVQARLPLDTFS